ncbi:MAG: hypothetical protein IK024_00970 [Treponema sp.]|nr:hypothetical protein [Treponema sp.]
MLQKKRAIEALCQKLKITSEQIVAMDDENIYYMNRCWGPDPDRKIVRLLSFAGKTRDIADPWYTGNFDQTYEDIVEGCTAFLKFLG